MHEFGQQVIPPVQISVYGLLQCGINSRGYIQVDGACRSLLHAFEITRGDLGVIGQFAGQHFISKDTQRKNIRAVAGGIALQIFGCGIVARSEQIVAFQR